LPDRIAIKVMLRKMRITDMATHFFEMLLLEAMGLIVRVFSTGQMSTHFMQDEHSSETTVLRVATFMKEGQTCEHLLQWIHDSLFLLILLGLKSPMIFIIAPKGHKYLHQKPLKIKDRRIKLEKTTTDKLLMFAKKSYILMSQILLKSPSRKRFSAGVVIPKKAIAISPNNKYFSDLRILSIIWGISIFFPKTNSPKSASFSDKAPNTHTQLQNDLGKTKDISKKLTKSIKPAGCAK
jgi:hypothetical protein